MTSPGPPQRPGASDARAEGGGTPGGGTYKRRKFVNKHGGGLRGGKNVNMEALQNALEEDSSAVEELRRDMESFQELEINSSHEYLANLRRTYDKLRAAATTKEQQHRDLVEELKRLDDMINEQQGTSERDPVDDETDRLDAELIDLQEKVKDALVQRDIFTHMINRLSEEALDIQVEGTQIEAELQKDSNELQQCNVALQQAKQELKHEERKFHALQAKVNERRETQKARISDIEKIIAEREQLVQRQQERTKQRDKLLSQGQLDAGKPEDTKVKKMQVVRKVYNSMLEKKISNEEDDLAQLEATFQHIKIVTGLTDVDDIVQKFLTRKEKAEQLERDADDIRQRIETLKVENEKQRQILEAMRAESHNTAGNRKAIFQMERSNQHLQDLKHQCDEAKKRAYRSSVSLEELKTAVTRFRSKVEGKPFPIPKNSQISDYLKELDSKLTSKLKTVTEALGDLTSGAAGPEAGTLAKLQSEKLEKMIHSRMMATMPDSGPRNVRVSARASIEELNRLQRRGFIDDYYDDVVEPDVIEVSGNVDEDEEKEAAGIQEIVDRVTVKKLSNLIVQRDNPTRRKRTTKRSMDDGADD
jgi:chromosome segregation ATPase